MRVVVRFTNVARHSSASGLGERAVGRTPSRGRWRRHPRVGGRRSVRRCSLRQHATVEEERKEEMEMEVDGALYKLQMWWWSEMRGQRSHRPAVEKSLENKLQSDQVCRRYRFSDCFLVHVPLDWCPVLLYMCHSAQAWSIIYLVETSRKTFTKLIYLTNLVILYCNDFYLYISMEKNGKQFEPPVLQGFMIIRSVYFSDAWFWFSIGLVCRATAVIQPRQVVCSGNIQ